MYNEKDETQDVEDDRRVFEELSFSRLIVVPLFFIDFVGVRKENERLTAIPSELFQKYSLENRSGRFHLLLGLALESRMNFIFFQNDF